MVNFLTLLLILSSTNARADFLGFGGDDSQKSKLVDLTDKLRSLTMKVDPSYEEAFNKGVKDIETALEEEKLFCSGEVADREGKTLPKEKKQLCMRELKKFYVESLDTIFELKKKYLGMIHSDHMGKLGEIHKKVKADVEKNF